MLKEIVVLGQHTVGYDGHIQNPVRISLNAEATMNVKRPNGFEQDDSTSFPWCYDARSLDPYSPNTVADTLARHLAG